MKVNDPGHIYELAQLDTDTSDTQKLIFAKRKIRAQPNRNEHPGTTCQEVIRALIHRVRVLDEEDSHANNRKIEYHLRLALVMFESRALERKVMKGKLMPETLEVDPRDGHFKLTETMG